MRSLNAGLLLRNFLLRPVPIDADVEGGVDIDGADADDNLKKRRHLKKSEDAVTRRTWRRQSFLPNVIFQNQVK